METVLYGNSGDASGWHRIAAFYGIRGMPVDGPEWLMEQAAPPDRPVRALDMQRRSAPRKKKPVRIYNLGGRPATRL